MEIRCIKGMYRLKLISSENDSGFKGLINLTKFFSVLYYFGFKKLVSVLVLVMVILDLRK